MRWAQVVAVGGLIFGTGMSAQPLPKFMGRQVAIISPGHTADGFPTGPASVCLDGPPKRLCYTAPKGFGNNAKVELVRLGKDMPALLFTAETGVVDGWSIHIALLGERLDPVLLFDHVDNQSQHAFWREATISSQTMFLLAEYAQDSDEFHYGRHRYIISAYFPNRANGGGIYLLEDRYMTARAYDLGAGADVLGSEKPEILARLRRVKAAESAK